MAMFGWSTGKMATHYTRAADRKRLARETAALMLGSAARTENESSLTSTTGAGETPKNRNKTRR